MFLTITTKFVTEMVKDGQSVWVKVDDEWAPGVVSGRRTLKTHTREVSGHDAGKLHSAE